MSTSTSLLPLLAVGVVWYYLSLRGAATQTIWLLLNILDTFKALRQVRPNGRRIGINTRKKVMRETLSCWTIYVLARTIGPLISTLLGWIPFFSPVKAVLCVAFLSMRVAASCHIFQHVLVPTVKPYEASIDLTALLIQSIGVLLFHYSLQVPLSLLITAISYARISIISFMHTILDTIRTQTHQANPQDRSANDEPTVDEDHIRASLLSPLPQIPGSILLRHPSPRPLTPRRSISFLSPPNTPKLIPPSPPSSDQSDADEIQVIAGPSTPRRVVQSDPDSGLLGVMEAKEVRRSPRRSRPQNSEQEAAIQTETQTSRRRPTSSRPISNGMVDNDNLITSSIKKGKTKVVPILIIPDEDEEGIVPITREIRGDRMKGTDTHPIRVDEISITPQNRTASPAKPAQSGSRPIPRSISTNLPEPSPSNAGSTSKPITSSLQNPKIPIFTSRSTSHPNPRNTSKSSESVNPTRQTTINTKVRSASTRSVRSNKTAAVATTTTASTSRVQPKPPRKPKIMKSSEGGIAHDKPILTAAGRSKAIIKTRARSRTAEIIDVDVDVDVQAGAEEKKEEVGKKVGEKRRRLAPPGVVDVRESRKRVKKV